MGRDSTCVFGGKKKATLYKKMNCLLEIKLIYLCKRPVALCSSSTASNLGVIERVGPLCCNTTVCECYTVCGGVYVCCRSHVLYSLCHTEYWLGGR